MIDIVAPKRGHAKLKEWINNGGLKTLNRRDRFNFLLAHRIWFIERHYYVPEKDTAKRIPMKLSHNGRQLVRWWVWKDMIGAPKRRLDLKSRQIYWSSTIGALVHSDAKYGPGGNYLMTGSQWTPDIETIYGKVQYYQEHMTEDPLLDVPVVGMKKTGSKQGLTFKFWDEERSDWLDTGGGYIFPHSGSFASKTAKGFWGTEIGIPRKTNPQWEELFKYSISTVPAVAGTFIILEGTARGPHGFLWDMWREKDDAHGGLKYESFFHPFFTHEEYRIPITKDCFIEPLGNSDAEIAEDEREIARIRDVIDRHWQIDRFDPSGWRYKYLVKCREEAINWRQHIGVPIQCKGDKLFFRHEYPATSEEAFVGMGRGIIDERKIMIAIDGINRREAERKKMHPRPPFPGFIDEEFETYIIHAPVPGHEYVGAGDPSKGVRPNFLKEAEQGKIIGGNPAVLTIFDATELNVAAVWRGWQECPIQAERWASLGWEYNNAQLIIDRVGGWGDAVLRSLRDIGYDNIYYHIGEGEPGFKSAAGKDSIRNRAIALMTQLLEIAEIDDVRFYQELMNFGEDKSGKIKGLDNALDDMVFTLAMIAWWMGENGYLVRRRAQNTSYGQLLADRLLPEAQRIRNEMTAREKAFLAASEDSPKINLGDPLCRFMPRAKRPGVFR